MAATTPMSIRFDEDLKRELEGEVNRLGGTTATALIHEAVREHLARRCPTCGAASAERVAPGLSKKFQTWLEQHDREPIFLIVRTPTCPLGEAFKGKVYVKSQLGDRTVTLDAIATSETGRRSEATFLRTMVLDWRTGGNGTTFLGERERFELENPGIRLNGWGLTS